MLTANNAIIGLMFNVNVAAFIIMLNYYSVVDFVLFCIPHIILLNNIGTCIGSVVFKTGAYVYIISAELWLKVKRFNTALLLLNQTQNQRKFLTNFSKTFQWFIYLLTLSKDYNRFWIWQFSILIIWRSMTITFLSYIIFFYELPLIVFIMFYSMWATEQIVFFLLMIQVTNSVSPLSKSSKSLKNTCLHKNVQDCRTRIKVGLPLLIRFPSYLNTESI